MQQVSTQGAVHADMRNQHALLDKVSHPPQTNTSGTGTSQAARSPFVSVTECYTNVDANRSQVCVWTKSVSVTLFGELPTPFRSVRFVPSLWSHPLGRWHLSGGPSKGHALIVCIHLPYRSGSPTRCNRRSPVVGPTATTRPRRQPYQREQSLWPRVCDAPGYFKTPGSLDRAGESWQDRPTNAAWRTSTHKAVTKTTEAHAQLYSTINHILSQSKTRTSYLKWETNVI